MKWALFAVAGFALFGSTLAFFSREPSFFHESAQESFSLKEAVGQVLLIGVAGGEMTDETKALMRKIRPGGVLILGRNIQNEQQLKRFIEDLKETASIPLFIAVDQEGGEVSRIGWEESTSQADLKGEVHAFGVAKERARGLASMGITMNLAPMLDGRTLGDYLFSRAFQTDTLVAGALAGALVKGHKEEGVIAVPKHFPGYDGISFNPEEGMVPRVSLFPDTFLFEDLSKKVALSFLMISHVVYEDIDKENPFPFSKKGIALLQEKMGKEILVMSDDLSSKSMVEHYGVFEIGEKAMLAGVDVLLVAGYPEPSIVESFYEGFLKKAAKNPAFEARVRESAAKILKFKKEWYGF
jgi:beta-N-acetylhexosaminidase